MAVKESSLPRLPCPTELSNTEWTILAPLVPAPKPGGRTALHSRREIINGARYVLCAGGSSRMLPHDLPPWQTVYHYFRLWRLDGAWDATHTALREQLRVSLGREPTPSAAILNSQSVKTKEEGGSAATTVARR